MHSYRATDAARTAPYLTHAVNHHGQVTLVPPDNAGRVRQDKTPKSRSRQRQERNPRHEEEPKFNTGPGPLRNLVNNRGVRRPPARQDRARDEVVYGAEEDYPDYPPPSFLEATSSDASMSNATLPLVSQPASPITTDDLLGSPLLPVPSTPDPQPCLRSRNTRSPNDMDSDLYSLEVIDPESENIPPVNLLETTNGYRTESPTSPGNSTRGRLTSRHAAQSTLDLMGGNKTSEPESSSSSTKRKNKALSPLRTLFPYKLTSTHDRPFSAHPSPSSAPYAQRSSMHFLSTTSLKSTISSTPSPFSKGENFITRKLLSLKGKERLDSWEVVPSEAPESIDGEQATLTQTSPTRSQSFTYGTSTPTDQTLTTQRPPTTPISSNAPHPLSLRDRKVPPAPFPRRHKRQASSPPPPAANSVTVPLGPVLTSVRTRMPPVQQQQDKLQPTSSPLGNQSWRASTIESETESNSVLQRAMVTPLPLTPIDPPDDIMAPGWSIADAVAAHSADTVRVANHTTPTVGFDAPSSPDADISEDHLGQSSVLTNSIGEAGDQLGDDHSLNGRRHYPGRPLPQPPRRAPASTNPLQEKAVTSESPNTSGCLEGLLIDLEDGTAIENPGQSSNSDRGRAVEAPTTHSSSSVDLLGSIVDESNSSSSEVPAVRVPPRQTNPPDTLSELTDLDVLASRVHSEEAQDGSNYDTLLLLSEFIGPASPVASSRETGRGTSLTSDNSLKNVPPVSPNRPLFGNVEVERRRTTKDGRVKLKLVVLDAPVDRCGICLKQFKSGDLAQLDSACRHAFHDKCLSKWLARNNTCPMCRVILNTTADL